MAGEYGIARGRDKAMLTLSVRDAESGETSGRPMTITGATWDLIRNYELNVKEIREGDATYYIIPFEFLDREYRFFDLTFTPQGSPKSYTYKFNRQLWRQDGP